MKNRTQSQLSVSLPAGYIFNADDSSYQNIIITQSLIANLQPCQTKEFEMYGMCIESSDISPSQYSTYSPSGIAEPKLLKLAQFIEQNKFFSPTGQQAVWAYMNDEPIYTVASIDTSQSFKLQRFFSELTGKAILPIPDDQSYLYNYNERPRSLVVEGEINFRMNYKIHVEWALYNENGILIRELYNGYLEPGEQTLSFSYDATVYTEPVYYLKLGTDGELMYNKKISFDEDED